MSCQESASASRSTGKQRLRPNEATAAGTGQLTPAKTSRNSLDLLDKDVLARLICLFDDGGIAGAGATI